MKCANCESNAFYIYQLTAKTQLFYCNKHLPSFLAQAKKAGLLKTTEAYESVIEEGLKNIAMPAPVAAVVGEPVVEEAQVPAPKKKATKKKAE